MGFILGLLYTYLWFASIFAGYAVLFCPLLPLLFLSSRLYRSASDIILTFWQYYPTKSTFDSDVYFTRKDTMWSVNVRVQRHFIKIPEALVELVCGTDIQVTGDPVLTGETSILISNHRTRTDWNFLWPTMYHAVKGRHRVCHGSKFILKDVIRHFVGPGWVMQLAGYIFIKRNWDFDRKIIKKYTDFVADFGYKHSVILFPEGTDFTQKTKRSSDSYSEKNGFTKYDFVLHPRTTGFCFMVLQMVQKRCLDALYDVTLVYPDLVPQNEKVLFSGHFPKVVKVHLNRYPVKSLPTSEDGLKDFLEKRWSEKEKTIKEFFATGNFLHGASLNIKNTFSRNMELYFALVFWTVLPFLAVYLLFFSSIFRCGVCFHTVFFVALNFLSDGFPTFEIDLFNFEQKVKNWFSKENQRN